jgi:uncharacterized protein (DUF302 family)
MRIWEKCPKVIENKRSAHAPFPNIIFSRFAGKSGPFSVTCDISRACASHGVTAKTIRRLAMAMILARGMALFLTLVLVAVAGARGDDAASAQKTSVSTTTHVNVSSVKPFDALTAAIEKQLGKYDAATIAAAMNSKLAPAEIEAKIHAMEGSSGFMLFAVRDHGQLLSLAGKQGSARQYEVGNPLIALQMTQVDVRAGEYAPLRVYVYAGDDHLTHVDYDLPSSVFGRLHSAEVDKVAKGLDEKLDALIANALKN